MYWKKMKAISIDEINLRSNKREKHYTTIFFQLFLITILQKLRYIRNFSTNSDAKNNSNS